MNSNTTLTASLQAGLLHHLQAEFELLERVQQLCEGMTAGGFSTSALADHQTELSALVADLLDMQLRRSAIREAIARIWNCDPATVRFSQLRLDCDQANEEFQRQRNRLMELTAQTQGGLQATASTLRGWSDIVGSVLGELLDSGTGNDRYTATGQRVSAIRSCGIEVRS